jgi:hypothetical protein
MQSISAGSLRMYALSDGRVVTYAGGARIICDTGECVTIRSVCRTQKKYCFWDRGLALFGLVYV